MIDQIESAINATVQHLSPGAHGITLVDAKLIPAGDSHAVYDLRVSWRLNDELHIGQFVAKRDTGERRILEALDGLSIPTPRLLPSGSGPSESFLIMERLPGRMIAEVIRSAGMRWELTALAFSYARMLAEIHALDWRTVAPWMAGVEEDPEEIVDIQVDAMWEDWTVRIARLPADARAPFEQALAWLDLRRPVEVSLCLCHGDYSLTNVLIADDEVSGVLDWESARVTDASYDLALLPFELRRLGLPVEDAELFAQAAHGAYLQNSPRSLGNLSFYTVARLLDRALAALELAGTAPAPEAVEEAGEWLGAMRQAMAGAGRVPWRG
ncbi:aminoglycoside phosphotransferase APH(3') [Nitrolancea hollandica]|uniref:Putative Aminoglycoside 3'-phosphotransferase n=1 Tax=Nitrolancea hollandica Lb TaxID=1129897 RepID=I4EIU7_9BACT|nr:aminoglycoside phosphotransferase APH(3') [Nitrolancea hollandica]CCF84609.1 putative Aminoglycoside 3'-phosphotransferase [Nitrolancea hollandica Lb]